jgi:hypothetical protein
MNEAEYVAKMGKVLRYYRCHPPSLVWAFIGVLNRWGFKVVDADGVELSREAVRLAYVEATRN